MFQFKQFQIKQEKTAMKVGTDGVLLGAWADFSNSKSILDIGTGTGLIALMAAQKTTNSEITAIEIEENAFLQAKENFEQSVWNKRITLINSSFQDFVKNSNKKFDFIVCNPPFFSNSLKNPNIAKSMARHNDFLPFQDLFGGVENCLNENGKFSLIFPSDSINFVIKIANDNNLFCSKITYVKPNPDKEPKRILIEFSKFKTCQIVSNIISIETGVRHNYSQEYINLTKDFYLKM